MDPVTIGMDQEVFDALLASPGTNILSTKGEVVGMIENVMVNAVGNPELVVDLTNQSEIPAEVLVVTVQPGSVMTRDGLLYLDTSIDELQLKARNNSGRDSDDRVQITLF